MPEISRFFGIKIKMFYGDHAPPHFHAEYEGKKCIVDFHGRIIAGNLPPRALGLVIEWTLMHKDQLSENWSFAEKNEPLKAIEPLK